jgi:glutathione S-transferase
MPPTLYHVPRTISSPIVQILIELGVVDDPIAVKELSFPELKSSTHLVINPMGTSPAFHDTDLDVTMWESGAILDYLLERYDPKNQFFPAPTTTNMNCDSSSLSSSWGSDGQHAVAVRSKYLHLKQYIVATVYPFIASLFIHSLKPENEIDHDYMNAAKEKCHTVLGPVLTKVRIYYTRWDSGFFDSYLSVSFNFSSNPAWKCAAPLHQWLGDGPYFLGDTISAVDFLAAKPLNNAKALGLLDDFPHLDALLDRVSSRPSFKPAYEGGMKGHNDQTIVMVPSKDSSVSKLDGNVTVTESSADSRLGSCHIPSML